MGKEKGDKIVCPKCQNDTFRFFEKRLSTRLLAGRERQLVCAKCGYSESIYKIGDEN